MKRLLYAGLLAPLVWSGLVEAQPLTQQQALQRLGEYALLPSSSLDEITASMTTTSLATGVVQPIAGPGPVVNISDFAYPQWFAVVDLHPCQWFDHEVIYVFIDDDLGGTVTLYTAYDWPEVDGVGFGDGYDLVMVFPLTPRPSPVEAGVPSAEPVGDYGDAPEGVWAYEQVTGAFPTYYNTTNSVAGRPGIHMLNTGLEMLGVQVSDEQDVNDPLDPDGVTNMRDADSDERMFLAWDPSTYPPIAHLIYDVTVAPSAPVGARHINALFDFDRSGHWAVTTSGSVEWAIVNEVINVAPGTTATLVSQPFAWEDAGAVPTQVWMRVALTRAAIDPDGTIFGGQGWDGSGAFDYGEVEDFETYIRRCKPARPPVVIPPFPPPPPPPLPGIPNPPGGGGGGGPAQPGPTDMLGKPISYYALIVQGPDKGSDTAAVEAADTMQALLGAQGYGSSDPGAPDDAGPDRLNPDDATEANIQAWIDDLVPNVLCKDHVVIYIIGHGSHTAGGSIHLGENVTGSELADMLDKIPSDQCDGQSCKNSGCCDVSVIIESCYAGNFKDALAGPGRNIYVSSSSSQPSQYGHDGSGGEYSDRYADAKRNQANADADGYITPGAAHSGAGSWGGQTPDSDEQGCACVPVEHDTIKFVIFMDGPSVVPVFSDSPGIGQGHVIVDLTMNTIDFYLLTSGTTGAPIPGLSGIFGPAPPGTVGPLLWPFEQLEPPYSGTFEYDEALEPEIMAGMLYVQLNTDLYPEGEIRGQFEFEEAWEILPGDDLYTVPEGEGATIVFGDGDNPAIPPDFFGPGSDPFDGPIGFTGAPLETEPTSELGPSSVVVRRLGPAMLPGPGSSMDVPVQIVGLSLVSTQPITVSFGGGAYTELYDVTMSLSSTVPEQPIGNMTIFPDDHFVGKGGIFLLDLPVQPSYTFTPVGGGGGGGMYDTFAMGLAPAMFHVEDGHWMKHDPGVGLYTHSEAALLDHDGDPGTPPMIIEPTVPFFPGVGLYRCDPGDPASWTQYLKRVMHAEGGYANLSLMPAQCLDIGGGVLDCAAPLPDTDGDFIPDGTDNCLDDPDPMQVDSDFDGVGDMCDNCPLTPNTCQKDTDMDGLGNACDFEEPIPATSAGALMVFVLLLLAVGGAMIRRQTAA